MKLLFNMSDNWNQKTELLFLTFSYNKFSLLLIHQMPGQNLVLCVYIIWCKDTGRALHNHRCIRIITLANRGERIIFFSLFSIYPFDSSSFRLCFFFVCCIFYSHRLFLFDVIRIGGVTTLTLFFDSAVPSYHWGKKKKEERATWPENQHPIKHGWHAFN